MKYSKKSVEKFIRNHKINPKQFKNSIIKQLKNQIKEEENIVIGISGGKDSTVIFKLLVTALGRSRVYPVFMPFINRTNLDYEYIDKFEFNLNNLNKANEWVKKYGYEIIKDKYYVKAHNIKTHKYSIIPDECILYFDPSYSSIQYYKQDWGFDIVPAHIEPLIHEDNNEFYTKFIGSINSIRIPIESDLRGFLLYDRNLIHLKNNNHYKKQLFGKSISFVKKLNNNMKKILENNDNYEESYLKMSLNKDRNFLARMRMNILYYIANSIPHGRVVNTSNLSEKILGWSTKWGDNVGDIYPLKQLTCHEVGALGLSLNIPEKYLFIPPSDGMVGETDENVVGIDYYELDNEIFNQKIKFKNFDSNLENLNSFQKNILCKLNLKDRIPFSSHKLYIN